MSTLSISVLDAATIFEGPDTLFRYDLPGTGIVEGWATEAVIAQAKELLDGWEHGDVELIGEGEAVEILKAELLAAGAQVIEPEPQVVQVEPRRAAMPKLAIKQQRGASKRQKIAWGLITSVALLAVIASWRWLASADAPAPIEAQVEPSKTTVASISTPAPPVAKAPVLRSMELDGLRVKLPVDFGLAANDGDVMATGEDPNLRILLSKEQPGRSLSNTLDAVRVDDSLEVLEAHARVAEAPAVVYLERSDDGSQVRWTQWQRGEHMLFVGCQTREAASNQQLAACDQAVASLELG